MKPAYNGTVRDLYFFPVEGLFLLIQVFEIYVLGTVKSFPVSTGLRYGQVPFGGRDSSVGIATRYGLEGPGGGEIFCTLPDRPWGPASLLYNGYGVFPRE